MATAGFCIHYKEFSFHLQEFKINSVFNLPRSSSFLLPVCAFADPRSVVTSGRLLSMLACCVLKWLLSPCHVKAGGLTRAYLIFGRERTTSKASCYSYEVFPLHSSHWLYPTFSCDSIRHSPWVQQLEAFLIFPCPLLRGLQRTRSTETVMGSTCTPTQPRMHSSSLTCLKSQMFFK
jgi:hypothetical protein